MYYLPRILRESDSPQCGIISFLADPENQYSLSISAEIYRVGEKEYYLHQSVYRAQIVNTVYTEDEDRNRTQVDCPEILAELLRQQQIHISIEVARDEYAAELADGDEMLESILRVHLWYEGGRHCPTEYEGITYYQVGRNASHSFYWGWEDGQKYRMSCGEGGCKEEGCDHEDWTKCGTSLEYYVAKVDDFSGYNGHA